MPGFLITQSATVSCAHQGRANPAAGLPTIKVAGDPVVAQATAYTVAACPLPPPSGGPCATGMWTSGTTRVLANRQPLAIALAPGTCAPTGVPMLATVTQVKVRAT